MNEYALLHIPRTGGMARAVSLAQCRDRILICDHPVRQSDLPAGCVAIVFVRHPVERFRSLWGHVHGNEPARLVDEEGFQPVTWWIDGDPASRVIYATETMDAMWPRLMEGLGIPAGSLPRRGDAGRNECRSVLPRLSARMVDALVDFYATDLAIWKDAL